MKRNGRSGDFPEKDKFGQVGIGITNPSESYDDDIYDDMEMFRDEWYDMLREMSYDKRSPVWRMIRTGRQDELLRAIMLQNRVITKMGESVKAVKMLEHTSEFQERYSIPDEFFRHIIDLKKLIEEGEVHGAKGRVDDIVTDFKKYRELAASTTTMAVSEVVKFAYLIDGLRRVKSILRDVRFTLKEDGALMLTDRDYVSVANIVYNLLIKKLVDKNSDLVIPENIIDIDKDLEQMMSNIRRGKSYRDIDYTKRVNDLMMDYLVKEGIDNPMDLKDEEINRLYEMFGTGVVDRWLGD